MNGFETYVFKMSSLEQSSAITTGCTKFLWPPGSSPPAGSLIAGATGCGKGGGSVCVPCGTQKTGVLWGENLNAPYPIGDTTLR